MSLVLILLLIFVAFIIGWTAYPFTINVFNKIFHAKVKVIKTSKTKLKEINAVINEPIPTDMESADKIKHIVLIIKS